MAAILRDSAIVVVFAAVVRTRPRAKLLALMTMRKSIHGFPFHSYMSMGLHLAELRYKHLEDNNTVQFLLFTWSLSSLIP